MEGNFLAATRQQVSKAVADSFITQLYRQSSCIGINSEECFEGPARICRASEGNHPPLAIE